MYMCLPLDTLTNGLPPSTEQTTQVQTHEWGEPQNPSPIKLLPAPKAGMEMDMNALSGS